MKANHSPLYIYPSSVINKLNTENDFPHLASHCTSLQGEGVPGLQLLVHSAPTSGAHPATVATAEEGGVVRCLVLKLSIFM